MQRIVRMTSMKGLGDNIYQRAFLKNLQRDSICVLDSPFPEIYQDLENVYFERSNTTLRTQQKNVRRTDFCGRRAEQLNLAAQPRLHGRARRALNGRRKDLGRIFYTNTGILKGLSERFLTSPEPLDLPEFEPSRLISSLIGEKYAIIRPVTVRTEWRSDSRNPLPEYLEAATVELKKQGFTTVSIADVDGINEMFVGKNPKTDISFNKGELSIKDMLCLVQHSSFILGGVGWIVPAAIAYKKKACIIGGGWGMYNHPDKLLPDYETDIEFILPDNFCLCTTARHDCDKTIKNFNHKFRETLCKLKPDKTNPSPF